MIVHVTDLVKILTISFSSQVFSFYVIEELDKASLKRKELERSEVKSSLPLWTVFNGSTDPIFSNCE